jgi:hypothetical protein
VPFRGGLREHVRHSRVSGNCHATRPLCSSIYSVWRAASERREVGPPDIDFLFCTGITSFRFRLKADPEPLRSSQFASNLAFSGSNIAAIASSSVYRNLDHLFEDRDVLSEKHRSIMSNWTREHTFSLANVLISLAALIVAVLIGLAGYFQQELRRSMGLKSEAEVTSVKTTPTETPRASQLPTPSVVPTPQVQASTTENESEISPSTKSETTTASISTTQPQLAFIGRQVFEVAGSQGGIRYKLSVVNRSEYSDEIFEVAPDLPPCGQNTNASRSWVAIYDGRGKRLNGFCALKSSEELSNLWFGLAKAEAPPELVYIVIKDRKLNKEFKSNLVSTNAP